MMSRTPWCIPVLLMCACSQTEVDVDVVSAEVGPRVASDPTRILVVSPTDPSPGMAHMTQRFAQWLDQATTLPIVVVDPANAKPDGATLTFTLGDNPLTRQIIGSSEVDTLPAESYILRRGNLGGGPAFAADGPDLLGEEYAAYALLTTLGFGFFHPADTYVPPQLNLPTQLSETHQPGYSWRGTHLHTMHPIELMDSFLVPNPALEPEAFEMMEWLVANRQNYLQWVLQDTVDMETWIPWAQGLVDYAHLLGLKVGIDTPFRFIQQNGWVLVPHRGPWEIQIKQRLALVLQVPFDVINVELGASEFIPEEDTVTVDMLNFTAALLDEEYGVELISKVHVSSEQTAPNYGDINYNFLPGLCDPRVGVLPHSVQFYDLYRPAPTYDNEDFSEIREFLLGEIGERRVLYYPETAYWVSFDADVPLFLPQYVYARWNDLHTLRSSGMDGQVNFSSGFEWGYWLGDFAAASFAYEPAQDWRGPLRQFSRIFGNVADPMGDLLEEIVEEQAEDLLMDNQIAYLIGWDTADDFGELVGIHAQPEKITFEELRRMDNIQLENFQSELIPQLNTLEGKYQVFVDRMGAFEDQIPAASLRYYLEMYRALEVTSLRIGHVRRLYEGAITRQWGQLNNDPDQFAAAQALFDDAQALRRQGEELTADQETRYRYPVERIARPRENPTSYEFGYLYQVSDLYYWRRDELKAIDENRCPCLGNISDQISNLFGEGHPLQVVIEAIPELPPDCLNMCINPMTSIQEVGGSQ